MNKNVSQWKSFLSTTLLDLLTNEKPDERQIMTYVSCYYHAFQGAMQVDLSVCTGLAETEGYLVYFCCFSLCLFFFTPQLVSFPKPPKIAGQQCQDKTDVLLQELLSELDFEF